MRSAALLRVSLVLGLAACADLPTTFEPAASDVDAAFTTTGRSITILDVCDPVSFNAAIGAGTCINRNGGLTFDAFVSKLQTHQTVESWRFSPEVIHVPAGTTLPVINRGGEVHTFTEVAEFGGGIVPFLNALTGNPVPAPECINAAPGEFVGAGDYIDRTFPAGESKYMCCIHPWMRAVADGR